MFTEVTKSLAPGGGAFAVVARGSSMAPSYSTPQQVDDGYLRNMVQRQQHEGMHAAVPPPTANHSRWVMNV